MQKYAVVNCTALMHFDTELRALQAAEKLPINQSDIFYVVRLCSYVRRKKPMIEVVEVK